MLSQYLMADTIYLIYILISLNNKHSSSHSPHLSIPHNNDFTLLISSVQCHDNKNAFEAVQHSCILLRLIVLLRIVNGAIEFETFSWVKQYQLIANNCRQVSVDKCLTWFYYVYKLCNLHYTIKSHYFHYLFSKENELTYFI